MHQLIMEDQAENSFLLNMPELVLEMILSNITDRSNVSRTCKFLYEVVCGLEKSRRVMCIQGIHLHAKGKLVNTTIDNDAVFDSIMNSLRPIKEIKLKGGYSYAGLNRRQSERMAAIMRKFGATITSFELENISLPINSILEWLYQAPKLESLTFNYGRATKRVTAFNHQPTFARFLAIFARIGSFKRISSAREETSTPSQLPNLKALTIHKFDGLLDIVNSIPAGAMDSYRSDGTDYAYTVGLTEPAKILKAILMKQHNIKCLHISDYVSDPTVLCDNHLHSLETLILTSFLDYDDDAYVVDFLKYHTNLKVFHIVRLSENSFKWICNNLKKLEIFQAGLNMDLESRVKFLSDWLPKLKKLRYCSTYDYCFTNVLVFKSASFENLSDYEFDDAEYLNLPILVPSSH